MFREHTVASHLVYFFLLGSLFLVALPIPTHAQLIAPAEEKSQLTLEPTNPEPGQSVSILLDAYSVNTAGASITWYRDGMEIQGTENMRKISITMGDIGEKTTIKAVVRPARAAAFTLEKTITPTVVDVIVEAYSYIPPFYRGRALGITQSPVRIIAIPLDGSSRDPRSYTYEWRVGSGVILGGALLGKNSIEYTLPLYDSTLLTVTVLDAQGKAVGKKTVSLGFVEPELHFYEESPLRGLGETALKETFALVGEETTIHGEPYFLAKDSTMEELSFAWSINGNDVTSDQIDPHTLTVRKTGSAGSAIIELLAQIRGSIGRYVQNEFTITF